MSGLFRALQRVAGFFSRRTDDAEFDAEMREHLHLLTERYIARGMPPEEAARTARRQFGNATSLKEQRREMQTIPMLESLWSDVRFAARTLVRNPGFTTTAVLSLAIGIGANTAIFSLVNAVLLRPLNYRDSDRIFAVREVLTIGAAPVNPAHAREWAKTCQSLERVALMQSSQADLATGGEPASFPGAFVSHDLLTLLGVEPILGRSFVAEEEQEGNQQVALLSESLWRNRFNADRSIVGKTVLIDRQSHRVAGVLPDAFRIPYFDGEQKFDVIRPLVLGAEELARLTGNYNYAAVVKLKPGVGTERALAEIDVVQARFREPAGASKHLKASLIPVHELVTRRARVGLWMLAGAVGAVLLIVCINLANLLLARIVARGREAAIRSALGASRIRQFRFVLTECFLLSAAGGLLGIPLATGSLRILANASTLDIPRLAELRVDTTVLMFAVGLTLFTSLLFGLFPAWRLSSGDPQRALHGASQRVTEGRGGMRIREGLIAAEVALSTALLVVAGLLTASLTRLLQVDTGFESAHVITVDFGLSGDLYAEPAVRERFFNELLLRVDAIPGVEASGVTSHLPTLGSTWNDPIYLEGAPRDDWQPVDNRYASPGYFRAMNIALLRGRAFEERDRQQSVAVLSEKAAELLWPGDPNPVGRRFIGEDNLPKTLVGIAADVRASLADSPPPTAYYPYWQRVPSGASLVVRAKGDPAAAASAVRAALQSADAQLPVQQVRSMEEVVDGSVAPRRFLLILMGAFAVSALLVACLGIYGVVSHSVARRRNEIGIRMALGARRAQLLGLVIRQGMAPVLAGLAVGVAGALILGGLIRGLLFEVQPADPLTFGTVAAILLTVGALACLIPARRAASTDAVAALRCE